MCLIILKKKWFAISYLFSGVIPLTHFITFGKAGLEVCLQHDPRAPIKQLIFITNKVTTCVVLLGL